MRYTASILHGRGDGKRIGIPTLNFAIPEGFEEKMGVYAGWVWIGEERHPAAFHYGPVPTFDIAEPSLESHLIDTVLETAPESASFELVGFLRDIQNFATIPELQAQIADDVERTKTVLALH